MADIEVARAIVTIVPTMEGAQQTITQELTGAASSSGVSDAGKTAGSKFVGGLGKGLAVAGAATAAVTAAAIKAGQSFVSAAGDVAEYGDNIDKMSQKMGISAESYQEWDFVMQHCGTSMETLKSSMKTLATAAENGNEAFETLGITQEEIANMSQEELFNATLSALQQVEDETTRTYLAGQTLGRGATELGALLNMTAEDTDALKQSAHDLGAVLSDEAVASAAAYQDALQDMQAASDGLKNSMMAEFLPGITDVMNGLADVFSGNSDEGLGQISNGINMVVEKMTSELPRVIEIGSSIVESLATAILSNLPALADAALGLLSSLGTFIVDNLGMILSVGLDVLMTIANGIIENLPAIIPAIVDIILTIVDTLTQPDTLVNLVMAALDLIIALTEGIFAALPTLIERIPEIVINIVSALIQAAPQILLAAVKLIATLIQGIVSMYDKIREVGSKVVSNIKDAIMEKVNQAKEWGKDLIDNFISGIKEKWEALKGAVTDIANTIKDFIGFSEPDKGPLSNFHTFAPDMMDLFAEGIRDNIGTVKSAINLLAGEMDTELTANATLIGENDTAKTDSDSVVSGYTQNVYITSPKALSASEVARQTRNANRQMILALKGV